MTNPDYDHTLEQEMFWQKIYNLYRVFPPLYVLVVFLVTLLGFAYLLLFPSILGFGLYNLLTTIPQANTNDGLALLVIWSVVSVAAAVVTGNIITLRFPDVKGIKLKYPMAQRIHELLDQIDEQIDIPKIDNIVITEQLAIDIVKTPSAPLPIFAGNTLLIGLPLLQCLSPEYFQCAVTRKLMLYSKRRHAFTKWLHQMRQSWMQYLNAFRRNDRISNIPLSAFFALYAPFYRKLATPIAYREELYVDTQALELINDEDLLQTMEAILVTKIYLDRQYWPNLELLISNDSPDKLQPYSELEQVLKNALTTRTTKRWLDAIYRYDANRIRAIPDLKTRMDNIGRSKIRIPEKISETAAHFYLAKDYAHVIAAINRIWMQKHMQPTNLTEDQDTNASPEILPIDGTSLALPSTIHKDIFTL